MRTSALHEGACSESRTDALPAPLHCALTRGLREGRGAARACDEAGAMANTVVPGRSARAGRVLGGARGARRGYELRGHVSARVLHVRGGRARYYGGRAPAVVAQVVRGGVTAARAAAADEQRGKPGLAIP